MQLVACANCHTQYDVSDVVAKTFPCRCGEVIENRPPDPVDAEIHRCGSCGALVTADLPSCSYCGSEIVRDPRDRNLICPECFARNEPSARFCVACGVAFAPQPVRVDGHELPCPCCGALMPPEAVAGVTVNECRGCSGLWVPGEHFDLLVSRASEARARSGTSATPHAAPRVTGSNPAAQRVQYRKCPECDAFMHRRNFRKSSGVIIDSCSTHGTWLDADELEQIAGFILSGGRTAACFENPDVGSNAGAGAEPALARLSTSGVKWRFERGENSTAGSLVELLAGLLG